MFEGAKLEGPLDGRALGSRDGAVAGTAEGATDRGPLEGRTDGVKVGAELGVNEGTLDGMR